MRCQLLLTAPIYPCRTRTCRSASEGPGDIEPAGSRGARRAVSPDLDSFDCVDRWRVPGSSPIHRAAGDQLGLSEPGRQPRLPPDRHLADREAADGTPSRPLSKLRGERVSTVARQETVHLMDDLDGTEATTSVPSPSIPCPESVGRRAESGMRLTSRAPTRRPSVPPVATPGTPPELLSFSDWADVANGVRDAINDSGTPLPMASGTSGPPSVTT